MSFGRGKGDTTDLVPKETGRRVYSRRVHSGKDPSSVKQFCTLSLLIEVRGSSFRTV